LLTLANQDERKSESSQVRRDLQGGGAADGVQRPPGQRGGPFPGHRGEHHLPLEKPPQGQRKQRGRASPACTGLPGPSQAHPGAGDRAGYLKKSLGHSQ